MPHSDSILLIYMGSHDLLHGFHVYYLGLSPYPLKLECALQYFAILTFPSILSVASSAPSMQSGQPSDTQSWGIQRPSHLGTQYNLPAIWGEYNTQVTGNTIHKLYREYKQKLYGEYNTQIIRGIQYASYTGEYNTQAIWGIQYSSYTWEYNTPVVCVKFS